MTKPIQQSVNHVHEICFDKMFNIYFVIITLVTGCTRKTRIVDTVYNASNNELVRTKTLVKNSIITVDAVPFRQWYEAHYATPLARKKGAKLTDEEEARINKKRSKKVQAKYTERQKLAEVEPHLIEQFQSGRLLGSSFSSFVFELKFG